MHKPRVYLDTSVPSALLDSRTAERQQETREFWDRAPNQYRLCISEIVLLEIANTPTDSRRAELAETVNGLEVLPSSTEAEDLAEAFMAENLFPAKFRNDAMHLAIAIANSVPIVASWNFTHMLKLSVQTHLNLLCLREGYGEITIVAPAQL